MYDLRAAREFQDPVALNIEPELVNVSPQYNQR